MTKEEILELRKRLSTLRAAANLDRNFLVLVEIIKAEIMIADHEERWPPKRTNSGSTIAE